MLKMRNKLNFIAISWTWFNLASLIVYCLFTLSSVLMTRFTSVMQF